MTRFTSEITATLATTLVVVAFSLPMPAQDVPAVTVNPPASHWHSDAAVYVAGLADIKPGSAGSLKLTDTTLDFAGKAAHGEIELGRITAVYTGEERVATGGTSAKVARHIPIYGFGAVAGAVTNRMADLLTVEYTDQSGGDHGVVFELPRSQAAIAQKELASVIQPGRSAESLACLSPVSSQSIVVAPIASEGTGLPAEYRVLLYEQLVDALKSSRGKDTVYRTGDSAAHCAPNTLQLSVTAFKKGNEALRASTGPVGLFVGVTSLTFHVSLVDQTGAVLFEKSLKERKHGDADSLSITRDLAKSVSKRLAKADKSASRSS